MLFDFFIEVLMVDLDGYHSRWQRDEGLGLIVKCCVQLVLTNVALK